VLLANKNKIELAAGVDLLYFVHDYQAIVLVQYKRVRRVRNDLTVTLDDQLDAERRRMVAIESEFRNATIEATLEGCRLADKICFFKLCETEQSAEISDLSRGRYVDVGTWAVMDRLGVMTGPLGGRRLRYDDVTRYLNNSAFAELVSEGWVGSVPSNFEPLLDYVFERYGAGRAVILGSLHLGRSSRRIPNHAQRVRRRAVSF
jgi:hypothetical protein